MSLGCRKTDLNAMSPRTACQGLPFIEPRVWLELCSGLEGGLLRRFFYEQMTRRQLSDFDVQININIYLKTISII